MVSFFPSNSVIYFKFQCSSDSVDSVFSWCFANLVCFSSQLDTYHQLLGTDVNTYSVSRCMWTCLEIRMLLKFTVALDPSGILKTFFVTSTHQTTYTRRLCIWLLLVMWPNDVLLALYSWVLGYWGWKLYILIKIPVSYINWLSIVTKKFLK